MTQNPLPKSLHTDTKQFLSRKMATVFPATLSDALHSVEAVLEGNVSVNDLKVIGFQPGQHRRVSDDLSVLHGYILCGIKNDKPLCRISAKIAFSTSKERIAGLTNEDRDDDQFLQNQAYISPSTSALLQYDSSRPYKAFNSVVEIPGVSMRNVQPPFSKGTTYARLFLDQQLDIDIPKNTPKEALFHSGFAYDTSESISQNEYETLIKPFITRKRDQTFAALGLDCIDVSFQSELGRATPLPANWHELVSVHNRGSVVQATVISNYGPDSTSFSDKQKFPLFTGAYKIYFATSPEALEALSDVDSWEPHEHPSTHGQKLGNSSLTLRPVTETIRLDERVYAQAFGLPELKRSSFPIPKLPTAPHSNKEKQALVNVISEHFNLRSKYADIHFALEGAELTENLQLLSGGRSGSLVAHFNAKLKDNSRVYSRHADYRWDSEFQKIREKGVSFVVRIANNPRQQAMLEHHMLVQRKLWEAGFPVPKVDAAGVVPYYRGDTGQSICLEEYVQGRHSDKLETSHLVALGKALGTLHGSGIELPTPPARNVLDEDVLINDSLWALENIELITRADNDEESHLPSKQDIYDSIFKELCNRFSDNEKGMPVFAYVNTKSPLLAAKLELNEVSERAYFAVRKETEQAFSHLPKASACWNDAHPGNLVLHEEDITMLDFGNSGEGTPARDLELSAFFACANDEGKLDPLRTRPFFTQYIYSREEAAKNNNTLPLTRAEVMALPKLLAEASVGRELAIAVMFRDKPREEYNVFMRRLKGLREQMREEYMNHNGDVTPECAERFAMKFFGMGLGHFPAISSAEQKKNEEQKAFSNLVKTVVEPYRGMPQKPAQIIEDDLSSFLKSEKYLNSEMVILDLWGIVNDDTGFYPEAITAIKQLKHDGKKIVFMSNSPLKCTAIKQRLLGFGLREGGDYDAVITAGDTTLDHFGQENQKLKEQGKKKKYLLIGNEEYNKELISSLEQYEITYNPDEADFILCTSAPDNQQNPEKDEELKALFTRCAAMEKPPELFNANPDVQCPDSSGNRVYCGGAVAKMYEDLGGKVRTFGKPSPDIYRKAARIAGLCAPDEEVSRHHFKNVIAVGDSLKTDIAGAKSVGIFSILVRNSLHYHELPEAGFIKPLDLKFMKGQFKSPQRTPDLVVSSFSIQPTKQRYASVPEVIPYYKYALVNIGGVLKDDKGFFKKSVEALRYLSDANKQVVIVSNTPYRAEFVRQQLEDENIYMGDHYSAILTAGEVTYQHFKEQNDPNRPKYYCLISGEEDSGRLLDGLSGYIRINKDSKNLTEEDLAKADFVLCTSAPDRTRAPETYFCDNLERIAEQQRTAHRQGKDFIFYDVNSDIQTPQMDGSQVYCGGAIAKLYEEKFGVKPHSFGKPEKSFYDQALSMFVEVPEGQNRIRKKDVICIDDSSRSASGAHAARIKAAKVGREHYHSLDKPSLSAVEGAESLENGRRGKSPEAVDHVIPTFALNNFLHTPLSKSMALGRS